MIRFTRNPIARLLVAMTAAGAFTAACDVHGASAPGTLSTLTISPNPQTLAANATQQFTAVAKDFSGVVIVATPVWSIVSGGGAITASGMFTAGTSPGTFANTVKATSGSISSTATIIVTVGPLATITITPNPATLGVGATQQFVAVGKDASGNIAQITPTWSVTAGGGSINSTGVFTAGGTPGTFFNTVQASSGGIVGSAVVNVVAGPLATIVVTPNPATLAAGATQQFTALGSDASGNAVAITPVWSVVNGGGTIDAATGLFTAGAVGGTFAGTVKATSGAIAGVATVTVNAAPTPTIATITVTPNPVTLASGTTQQFTAVAKDANGVVVTFTPVWSVVNGGGTINASSGLFTAGATVGTFSATVKAASGAISGSATVTVTAAVGPLASITVTPNPATVIANATQQFTAVGKDANGVVISIVPVWSVVNGGGTINAVSGLFTAGGTAGTFAGTVKATSGAIAGVATVTVTAVGPPPPLVNLGAAAANGIMAGTAVTCVSLGTINADVSISPGSTITGFPPCVITGVRHLADAVAAQAQIDLTTAYNTLAGLPCAPANAIVANLGGTTKAAGVYCTASGIGVTGTLTLDGGGDPNATFVFQAGTSLTTAGSIVLINGAQARNVWWQVGSSATIGTASAWQGNIVALTSITLVDNATLLGRALARNGAVSLGTNNVITLP
ncbi:MAG: ice-binding family protein [bacterium]